MHAVQQGPHPRLQEVRRRLWPLGRAAPHGSWPRPDSRPRRAAGSERWLIRDSPASRAGARSTSTRTPPSSRLRTSTRSRTRTSTLASGALPPRRPLEDTRACGTAPPPALAPPVRRGERALSIGGRRSGGGAGGAPAWPAAPGRAPPRCARRLTRGRSRRPPQHCLHLQGQKGAQQLQVSGDLGEGVPRARQQRRRARQVPQEPAAVLHLRPVPHHALPVAHLSVPTLGAARIRPRQCNAAAGGAGLGRRCAPTTGR